METKINFDNVGLHVENDIIFCSVKRFKLFLAERNYDAYTLFSFYMMTARVQDTKQVWANDVFVRNGLKWGKDKMQKAKKFLIEKKMSFSRVVLSRRTIYCIFMNIPL